MAKPAIAIMMVLLAGCATREDRLAAWRDRCATDYGFARGSEAHGNCVMQHDLARRRALTEANQPPIIIPVR